VESGLFYKYIENLPPFRGAENRKELDGRDAEKPEVDEGQGGRKDERQRGSSLQKNRKAKREQWVAKQEERG
jgi:hypothetical protein